MSIGIPCSPPFSRAFSFLSAKTYQGTFFVFSQNAPSKQFKSNVRETWRVILVSEADIFFTESLRILAERLSQSENGLPLRQICYYSPPEEVGVFSTEINAAAHAPYVSQPILLQLHISIRSNALYSFLFSDPPYHTTRKETLQKN